MVDLNKDRFKKEQSLLDFDAHYYTLLLIHLGIFTGKEKDLLELDLVIRKEEKYSDDPNLFDRCIAYITKRIRKEGWVDKENFRIHNKVKYFERALIANIRKMEKLAFEKNMLDNVTVNEDDLPF